MAVDSNSPKIDLWERGFDVLKYTNGLGHLIMSIACLAVGVLLVYMQELTTGLTIISMVASAWFVPGAANMFAHSVAKKIEEVVPTSSPNEPPAPEQEKGG